MAKTTLDDLNRHLFGMLEQITDDTDEGGNTLSDDAIRQRIARSGAVTKLAREILDTQRLALDAARLRAEDPNARTPRMLGLEPEAEGEQPGLVKLRQVQ